MPPTQSSVRRGAAISLDSVDEPDLVRQVAAGSTDALASLYRRHGPSLYRLALRITASDQDAEDILHDLFVGLPEAIHKYAGRGSLQGWLQRVLVRLTLMRLRAARRRREVDLSEEISAPAAAQSAESGSWDLQRAIATLPDDLRAVLVLRQAELCTHREIAAMLGITPGASRVRLARAVKLLKQALRSRT